MSGYSLHAEPEDLTNDYNAQVALIDKMINQTHTITVARVTATYPGRSGPVGSVDVRPLVNQLAGDGSSVEHNTLFGLPCFRPQGGPNAVIIDPEVGDLGIVAVCSRDITKVKNTKAAAAPDTRRTYNLSDGVYLGGILNGAASQYVWLKQGGSGIEIVSGGELKLTAPTINLNGNVISSGTFQNNNKNIGSTHTHPDPQGSNTGTPQ
jgi:hypothetical protein